MLFLPLGNRDAEDTDALPRQEPWMLAEVLSASPQWKDIDSPKPQADGLRPAM